MSKQTNEERLVVVETKLDFLIEQQKITNHKLETLLPTLATADAMNALKSEMDLRINEIHSKRWLQNTLSGLLGSVLTLLIARFITTL